MPQLGSFPTAPAAHAVTVGPISRVEKFHTAQRNYTESNFRVINLKHDGTKTWNGGTWMVLQTCLLPRSVK